MALRSLLDLFRKRKKKDGEEKKKTVLTDEGRKQAGTSAADIEKVFGEKPKKTDKKPTPKKKPTQNVSRKTVAEIADMVKKSQEEKKKRREALKKAALTGKK